MEYYLVPYFEQMSSKDLYLLAFYSPKIVVSDGLAFWKFFEHNMPLLSYLSQDDQARHIKNISNETKFDTDMINAYGELIENCLLEHKWFAGKTWDLIPNKNDSLEVINVIERYNDKMKGERRTIVDLVYSAKAQKPYLPFYEAIRKSRIKVGIPIIEKECSEIDDYNLRKKCVRKVKKRFFDHLKEYIESEKIAFEWSSNLNEVEAQYAGYLPDVLKDLQSSKQVLPIFTSSEVIAFLDKISSNTRQAFYSIERNDFDFRGKYNSFYLGFNTLKSLPNIGFQGVDEVLFLKEKLEGELHDFNVRMSQVSFSILADPGTEDSYHQINNKIINDLIPAANELNEAVKLCKTSINKWLLPPSMASIGNFMLQYVTGAPISTIIGAGILSISQLALIGVNVSSSSLKKKDLFKNPRYYGLSLALELQSKS